MRRKLCIGITSILFSFSLLTGLSSITQASTLLAEADSLYSDRLDPDKAMQALAQYEEVAMQNPELADAYWKGSRITWWIGENAASKRDKMKMFKRGIALGKKAVDLAPESVEAHFWLAVALSSAGEAEGIFKSMAVLPDTRKHLHKALSLNESYLGGGPYRLLGILDYNVPAIAGGNRKRAGEQLHKALAIDARNPFTLYYIAEYYSITHDRDKSKQHLSVLASLTAADSNIADIQMMQAKGEKLSKKIR